MTNIPLSDEDQQIAEEVLTEILILALTASPHLRDSFVALAEGFNAILSEAAIRRSADYAQYRAKAQAAE
jgi:hypothetical protein